MKINTDKLVKVIDKIMNTIADTLYVLAIIAVVLLLGFILIIILNTIEPA